MSTPLRAYHHIYADGEWWDGLEQHIEWLKNTELILNLDFLGFGIVGKPHLREKVNSFLYSRLQDYSYTIVAEEDEGFEQTTLDILYEDAKSLSSFKALYSHSKGASTNIWRNTCWRKDMSAECIGKWRRAVPILDEYDVAGPFWIPHLKIFAGNFFWANSEYVKTLNSPTRTSRFDAENWILSRGEEPKLFPLSSGMPRTEHHRPITSFIHERNYVGMIVTFRCDGRILNYKPGRIYEDILTPELEVLLKNGSNLVLIDPMELHPAKLPEFDVVKDPNGPTVEERLEEKKKAVVTKPAVKKEEKTWDEAVQNKPAVRREEVLVVEQPATQDQ